MVDFHSAELCAMVVAFKIPPKKSIIESNNNEISPCIYDKTIMEYSVYIINFNYYL